MRDLSHKIGPTLQPVFISKKLEHDLKPKEARPSIVNQQCVVYHFVCDLCDADYVGYTARHLFQRVAEHKNSAIGKHFHDAHGRSDVLNASHFKILRKCRGKFDCLVFEIQTQFNCPSGLHTRETFCLTCNFCNCLHRLLFFLVFIEPSFYAIFDLIMTLW